MRGGVAVVLQVCRDFAQGCSAGGDATPIFAEIERCRHHENSRHHGLGQGRNPSILCDETECEERCGQRAFGERDNSGRGESFSDDGII